MNPRWMAFAAACVLACHCPYHAQREEPRAAVPRGRIDACTMAQPDLSLLSRTELPPGFALVDQPRGYVGEQLFDLIDGGAVQYFDYGFIWALAGTYEREGGMRITVEVYRMGSAEQAGALFHAREVSSAESVNVGDAARYMAGSIELLRRCCLVTVTSFEPGDAGRQKVIALASRIDEELQG